MTMFKAVHHIKRNLVDSIVYLLGISLMTICKLLSYPSLCRLGKALGSFFFYMIKDYKKTALTNLALAFPDLHFSERYALAKQSVQHVVITLLELLAVERLIHHLDTLISIVTSDMHPEGFLSHEVLSKKELEDTFTQLTENEGLILFCGHQANWELPFLYITRDYPGFALAKPIKNKRLNKKITSLREVFQGRIASPKQGIKNALTALNQGHIIGIVGDQALLMSPYSYPLFGHQAFTTTTPALLAYKTGKPVIAISVYRHKNGYQIIPSKKFYADKSLPLKQSVSTLMDSLIGFLEKGITCKPEQWMWMHKRWKQKINAQIKKKYAYSHILILLPEGEMAQHRTFLQDFAELYRGAQLTLAIHTPCAQENILFPCYTVTQFHCLQELKNLPNTFQAIFDFAHLPRSIHQHFRKTGTAHIYTLEKLKRKLPSPNTPLIHTLSSFIKTH